MRGNIFPQLLCSTCISPQYGLSWNNAAIFGLVLQLVIILSLLDGIQRRIANLVGHDLASSSEPLSLRCSVASLSLFYRYNRCSKGLSQVVPPNRTFGRTTRFSAHSHPYTVSVPKANTRWYSSSFFPRTALLWNSLPVPCFPATYNLSQFKRNINSHHSTF